MCFWFQDKKKKNKTTPNNSPHQNPKTKQQKIPTMTPQKTKQKRTP